MAAVKRMTSSEEVITEMTLWRGGVEDKRYPAPMASHEQLLVNPTLFMNTLKSFHSFLGTRFMIPVIGGRDLDLHLLYVEVTKRGGFQKVIEEKKWKDVSTVFNFSPTATSASFVLRRHYLNLLLHYEQVYFFKLQGPLLTPSVLLPLRTESAASGSQQTPQLLEQGEVPQHKPTTFSFDLQTGLSMNRHHVVGVIDGKFDGGYLVTVRIGSETMQGILYHPSSFTNPPLPSSSSSSRNQNLVLSNSSNINKKKKRRRHVDPERPKPNRSGYNFFFAEKHSKLKLLYPNREKEFTKMIGESWSKLTPEERMVYQDIGMKDKERYKMELKEYKERKKHAAAAAAAETSGAAAGSTDASVQTEDNIGEIRK